MTNFVVPEGFKASGVSPYSQRIGPILYKTESHASGKKQGWVGLEIVDSHIGGNARGHGGLLMTILDEAMGMAAVIERDYQPAVTLSLQINFIAATLPGQFLKATGIVTHSTRSVAFIEGKAWCGDTLVGTANGVWKYLNVDYRMPPV